SAAAAVASAKLPASKIARCSRPRLRIHWATAAATARTIATEGPRAMPAARRRHRQDVEEERERQERRCGGRMALDPGVGMPTGDDERGRRRGGDERHEESRSG